MRGARAARLVGILCLFAFMACCGVGLCADAPTPPLQALLHLPFDGSTAAGEGISMTQEQGLSFADGQVGKALDLRGKGWVEYRNLPALNTRSGTIELWVRPTHDHTELRDHTYLQFFGKNDECVLEVRFYQVNCAMQVRTRAGKRFSGPYGCGGINTDKWLHIAATWDSLDSDLLGIRLYLNGKSSGYPASFRPFETPQRLRVGGKTPEEGEATKALIDEVCVYNRALTPMQAKTLYETAKRPFEEKIKTMRERVAKDEALARRRMDTLFNHRKIAMIHGRFTSLLHWSEKRLKQLNIPVHGTIHENELAEKLSGYDAVLVPGGGGLRLTDENKEALQRYVHEGGGYVGICGGAITAGRYGLIGAKRYRFQVRGPVWVDLKPHPVTEGYDTSRAILFPHASGPLFVPEDKSEIPVAIFQVGNPPLPTFVHTIAKQYGKGRVLVFSGHPESASRTYRLLRNAILWTAKVIDAGGDKEDSRGSAK
ncbi:MAG: hypothetical protein GXP25_01580 [Planctomycetes bacterium]|nr:hypothetical protein [Planctomycetota bacterium]